MLIAFILKLINYTMSSIFYKDYVPLIAEVKSEKKQNILCNGK